MPNSAVAFIPLPKATAAESVDSGTGSPAATEAKVKTPSRLAQRLRNFHAFSAIVNSPKSRSTRGVVGSALHSAVSLTQSIGTGVVGGVVNMGEAVAGQLGMATSPGVLTLESFSEYLATVEPAWDTFKRAKEESLRVAGFEGKPLDFSEIPGEYLLSDYRVSGILHHSILRQPLHQTVASEDTLNTQLTGYLEKVEMMLISHLANFDTLLQSLESLTLLEQGIFSAIEKIRAARERIKRVKESKQQVFLHILLRRKGRISVLTQLLNDIQRAIESEKTLKRIACAIEGDQVDSVTGPISISESVALLLETQALLDGPLRGVEALADTREGVSLSGSAIDKSLELDFVDKVSHYVVVGSKDAESGILILFKGVLARSLLDKCVQISLRDALLKRVKSHFKENVLRGILRLSRNVDSCSLSNNDSSSGVVTPIEDALAPEHELENRILDLSSAQFVSIWENCANESVEMICNRFQALALIFASSLRQEKPASPRRSSTLPALEYLLLNYLEISTTLTGRLAQLLVIRQPRQSHAEILNISKRSEPLLGRLVKNAENIAKTLRLPVPPLGAGGLGEDGLVESQLHRELQMVLDEVSNIKTNDIKMALSRERWEGVKAIDGEGAIIRVLSGEEDPTTLSEQSAANNSDLTLERKTLKIGRTNFFAVPSTLTALRVTLDFFELWKAAPLLGPQIISKLEHVLRIFNNEMRELVLEGKTVTLGVRSSVTAANLALAAQTAGVFSVLIPALANNMMKIAAENFGHFSEISGTAETANALEELKFGISQEFSEHREEIFYKLGEILVDRFDSLVGSWVSVAEEISTSSPTTKLAKDFAAMYRVLLKTLAPQDIKKIFSRAFNVMSEKFAKELTSFRSRSEKDFIGSLVVPSSIPQKKIVPPPPPPTAAVEEALRKKLEPLSNRLYGDLISFYESLTTGEHNVIAIADLVNVLTTNFMRALNAALPPTEEAADKKNQLTNLLEKQ